MKVREGRRVDVSLDVILWMKAVQNRESLGRPLE